jgi:ElaB/YqjD/DUF883 family membrane-anchored ribosome-binding protein
MPIPIDYVDAILRHYKYRIEQFSFEVKTLASSVMKQDLTELQGEIDAALEERNKIAKQEWSRKYEGILKDAKAQFKSDAEKFQKAATTALPYAELDKLHLLQRWVTTDEHKE